MKKIVEMIVQQPRTAVRRSLTGRKLSDRNSYNSNKSLVFSKGLLFVKTLHSFGYDPH